MCRSATPKNGGTLGASLSFFMVGPPAPPPLRIFVVVSQIFLYIYGFHTKIVYFYKNGKHLYHLYWSKSVA